MTGRADLASGNPVDLLKEREQKRLREERDRLHQQVARLVEERLLVNDKGDPLDRDERRNALEQHRREFRVFRQELDRFHNLYGPLGE